MRLCAIEVFQQLVKNKARFQMTMLTVAAIRIIVKDQSQDRDGPAHPEPKYI